MIMDPQCGTSVEITGLPDRDTGDDMTSSTVLNQYGDDKAN